MDQARGVGAAPRCSSGAAAISLVPIGFRKHVEGALPSARHLELDCGHVPQLEAPEQTHRAIREFFTEAV